MGNRIVLVALAVVAAGCLAALALRQTQAARRTASVENRITRLESAQGAPAVAEVREAVAPAATEAQLHDLKLRLDELNIRTKSHGNDVGKLEKEVALLKERIAELEKVMHDSAQSSAPLADSTAPIMIQDFDTFRPRIAAPAKGRAWGPEQATGPPDTEGAGDIRTAWATKERDAGPEWLILTYGEVINIASIHIYETYNPGAVIKVSAKTEDGDEVVIWQGDSPRNPAPSKLSFTPGRSVWADILVIDMDTSKVSGWNEIDAVEIVDTSGKSHWAVEAKASSTYAE